MRTIFFCFSLYACSLFVVLPAIAQQNGTIVIETTPSDALVRIMNISPPYEEGMELEPGVYDIEVSKEGYVTERKDVTVAAGTENRFTFTLAGAAPEGTLVVETEPADAQVRIMNIRPAYEEGISLQEGEYRLNISKPGYKTISETVTLKGGEENRFSYTLESAAPEPVTAPEVSTETPDESTRETPAESAPEASAEAAQEPGANATVGTLTVNTDPEGATVRILNIKPPYADGMELEPGMYALEISHPGYVTQAQDYTVEAGTENTVTVTLAPESHVDEKLALISSESAQEDAPAMDVMYEETFATNENGWYETESSKVDIAVQDGHYHIAHKDDAQGWIAWNKAEFDPQSEFAIEAVFHKIDGVLDYGYGLIWGVTNQGTAYHSFRISGNGLYSYRQENEGQITTVIDWTPNGSIAPGLGAVNTIHIRRQGDTLEFWVNGRLVDSTPYVKPAGTMVGFKVDNHQTVDVVSLKVGAPQ